MTTEMDYSSTNPVKRQRLEPLNADASWRVKLKAIETADRAKKAEGAKASQSFQNGNTSGTNNSVREYEVIDLTSDDDEVGSPAVSETKNVYPIKIDQAVKNEKSIYLDSDNSDDEIIILGEKKVTNNVLKPEPLNGATVPSMQFNGSNSSPQNGLQSIQGSDNIVRPLAPNQPIMPGSFNTPAPVPHVGDNFAQITREELKQRETEKLTEFGKLEQIKRTLTAQIQRHQQEFEVENQRITIARSQLSQANRLGNHALVERLRVGITKIKRVMDTVRNNINAYQRSLEPVEASILTVRGSLSGIANRLRTANHQANASFNPYEAQIYRDAQTHGSSSREPDVDVSHLLDNIVPDEQLQEGLAPTPPEMAIKLLKHQSIGLAWLKRMEESRTKGGILADDMGLGKTVQALALIIANKSKDFERKTTLIVAPVSLLRQWAAEVESKLHPLCSLRVGIYHGENRKVMSTFSALKKYDIVLVSYGTIASEWKRHYAKELDENRLEGRGFLPKNGTGGTEYDSPLFASNSLFYRVILDEAQNIKNKLAISSKAVLYLKAEYRLCLTGTPMQNKIEELYPIVRFLKLRPYYIEDKFRALVLPLKSKSDEYDDVDRAQSMRKLQAMLRSVMLRRTKSSKIDGQPILNLPEKHIVSDYVELEEVEMSYYRDIELGVQRQAEKMMSSNDNSCMFTLLLRLRQACCHQYLVEIGNIKTDQRHQAAETTLKLDWRRQLRNVTELTPGQAAKIKETVASSASSELTCSFCYDVEELNNFAVLGDCGHLVCLSCIDTFFDEHAIDGTDSRDQVATCIDCKSAVKYSNTFEYTMFEKFSIRNESASDVEEFYKERQRSNNLSNMSIIRDLTARDQGFEPSAKIEKSIELIRQIQESNPGQKIIIFSQFVTLFDLMKLVLDYQKIPFLRYDGSMSMENKNTVIKQFYQNDADVLLLSLRAGNVGLTLTCANHVIIMDPFWNPFVEEQAMDRAHRIGQEREVHVHRILVSNTVESRIMELQDNKKRLIGDALDENEMKSISRLGRRELGFLFGLNGLTERTT
ncbi:hypothetical protein CANMA_005137 [Candida margitis]|uniref:uncharacterized protein n=1 Tax=Candida margitis TaxID=1775924 RepID=UPI002227BD2D|nr:uncharacterized protein CANMA_005137 [Candida margitis]KAI5952058.1 hypothetical protein CANMA_005137 [Candida margitis]